jgi:hypothetical protein
MAAPLRAPIQTLINRDGPITGDPTTRSVLAVQGSAARSLDYCSESASSREPACTTYRKTLFVIC